MRTITIAIPEQLDAHVAAEAERRGLTTSDLVRFGLLQLLPRSAGAGDGVSGAGPGQGMPVGPAPSDA